MFLIQKKCLQNIEKIYIAVVLIGGQTTVNENMYSISVNNEQFPLYKAHLLPINERTLTNLESKNCLELEYAQFVKMFKNKVLLVQIKFEHLLTIE